MTARAQDAGDLAQECRLVGHALEHVVADRGLEASIRDRQAFVEIRRDRTHVATRGERLVERGLPEDAARAGADNVSFEVADVQVAQFGDAYDYAFARFGTMFFASPVAARRNVRRALRPGGRLNMVVWRRKLDNDWLHRAETIVERFLDRPEEYDDPTCGPGPFSMANADTVTDVLRHAGFEDIQLKRQDILIRIGETVEHAVDLVMSIGPGGEVLRLRGDRVEEIRPRVRAALLAGMADMARDDGVFADSSTWAVRAVAPH